VGFSTKARQQKAAGHAKLKSPHSKLPRRNAKSAESAKKSTLARLRSLWIFGPIFHPCTFALAWKSRARTPRIPPEHAQGCIKHGGACSAHPSLALSLSFSLSRCYPGRCANSRTGGWVGGRGACSRVATLFYYMAWPECVRINFNFLPDRSHARPHANNLIPKHARWITTSRV